MDLGLSGKSVVVTGASKGIGRATALTFADEGAHLAICARGEEALAKTADEIRAKGVKVHAATCDVRDGAALDAFLDGAREALGGVDVLVNNASGFGMSDDEDGWQTAFDVDVMATVRATWKVAPWLEDAGGGAVIHVASTSGLEAGSPPAYAAMKAAIISHSKTLAATLAPKKIRVNCISPGSIEFEGGIWDVTKKAAPDFYDSILGSIPFGRLGTDFEVANAIVFVASERASWIAGANIPVDGVQHKGNL
jgi:3-oxoacyl-[acyl-carrier protein] reductase